MTKFEIVAPECGDWEALYVNGKLVAEGHSIRLEEVLYAIQNILPNEYEYTEISDERAEEGFPEDRKELVDYIVD